MELKNIHTRKNFIKVNEIFGGTSGGVGSNDGFANNTKLKDTVLGKIINGLFKGISWLWRKSKENFIINRLIAQLVNELMRGIILFCFDNNISLTEGGMTAGEETTTIRDGNEEGWNENVEGDEKSKPNQPETKQSEPKKLTKEELIAKIEEQKKNVHTAYTTVEQIKANINQVSTKLKSNTTKEEKLKLDQQLNSLNGKLKSATNDYNSNVKVLNDLKEQLKNIGDTSPQNSEKETEKQQPEKQEKHKLKIHFDEVDKACQAKNKYSNFPDEKKRFEDVKSLPKDYSAFKDIKGKCYTFLEKYITEYNTMGDEDKEKIEKVYTQYKLIHELDKSRTSELTTESQIFEENLVRSAASNLTHSAGTVKIKPDEPRAGKVSIGKSIAMKAGVSANVGNILTKRDRDKHKDKEEFFDIDVHDINLAEIEKTVQNLEKTINDVRTKVSSYVNPYNVKTIQLSAEQLMEPRKTDEGTDNNDSLRLRWNKELTKTFASFTFIMDVDKISSIMKNESSSLNSEKLNKKVEDFTSTMKNQSEEAECSSKLPLIEGYGSYSKMSEGGYFYYSFAYNSRVFKTSISPVKSTFSDFGLVNITACINKVNDNNTIVEDTNLNDFKSLNSNSPKPGNIKKVNIYLLFKYNLTFPDSNRQSQAKVFVLNEYLYDSGESYIFLKKKGASQNVLISQDLIDNFTVTDYIIDTKVINFKKFSADIDDLKPALHIDSSNDFRTNKPKFLTDEIINHLKTLTGKI